MSWNEKYFEVFRLDYRLKHYTEIEALNTAKNLDVSILYFIQIALDNLNFDVFPIDFMPQPERIKYIYFDIISYYLYESEERKYTLKKVIDTFYDDNRVILKIKENKDTYRRKMNTFIDEIMPKGTTELQSYLRTQNEIGDSYKGHKISESTKRFFDTCLKTYNNITFSNIKKHRYKDITFIEYAKLVKIFRDDISSSNEEFKDREFYKLERFFHFELIKDMCRAVNRFDKSLPPFSKENENKKREFVRTILKISSLTDFSIRNNYIEALLNIEDTADIITNIDEDIKIIYSFLNVFSYYVIYLLESTYETEKIYAALPNEIKQFNLKYSKDGNYNNAYTDSYSNNYELNIDFTEDNFRLVIESLQNQYNFELDKFRVLRMEENLAYKVAKSLEAGLSIENISNKYQINNNYTSRLIKKYKKWYKSFINLDSSFSKNNIISLYRTELRRELEELKIQCKIVSDFGAGIEISKITTKYKPILTKNLGVSEINVVKYIPDYILKNYIISDYYDKIDDPQFKKSNITNKYEIEKKDLEKYITKKVIWLKLIDDFRRHPNMSISELGKKYSLSYNTVKKYIFSETPPIHPPRKNITSKLDGFKDIIDELLNCGYSSNKIFHEIKKQGYTGKIGIIKRYISLKNNTPK